MAREMKDSGIEWIGKIPIDWNMGRLLWCLEEIKDKNNPIKTTNVLSLTNKLGVVPYEEKGNQGNKAKEDYSQYSLAYEDTLVINSMNVLIGSVGISHYYGCVSPVYYVFKSTEKTDLRFINYIFQNVGFQKELRKYANGILEIRLRVSSHDMLRRMIPLPSKSEQERISDFLDTECSRIDSVIEETRTSIEEYKNLKQAVITQAVTKGIRSDRKMKDSGIECIGKIPDEWECLFLKYVTSFQEGPGIMGNDFRNEGVPLIRISGVKGDAVSREGCNYLDEEMVSRKWDHFRLSLGDVVISASASTGIAAIVNEDCVGCIPYTGLIRFPISERLNNEYLRYYLLSDEYNDQIDVQKTGTAIQHYGPTHISKVKIALPPKEEQNEIADYLKSKCNKIDQSINLKEQLLTELESYKKSLIYEFVTGKKEV